MRSPPAMVAALQGGALALLSVAVALAACEAALRLLHPRYEVAANPPDRESAGAYRLVRDPDTGVAHRVYYNNLGGRQSRNFPADSLDGAVNIAFFGDSQTENLFMPAQYSFVDPLDYLLNFAAGGRGNPASPLLGPNLRFNVLNFGVSGYGLGKAYLRWRQLPARRKLAHVVYMLVSNDDTDLRREMSSGVVWLAESGEVRGSGTPAPPAWKRLLAHLHLTYLVVDAWQRLAARPPTNRSPAKAGQDQDVSDEEALRVFGLLLRQWKKEVEAAGAAFHLVLLPNPPADQGWGSAARWLTELRRDRALRAEVGFFDLHACFEDHVPGFAYRDWSFARDPHWNPAANMVAASCLYRYLEDALGLAERSDELPAGAARQRSGGEPLADDAIAGALHTYYRAFWDSSAWEGQRYAPSVRGAAPVTMPADGGESIVAKYLALELATAPAPAWLLDAYRAGAAATSVWDVYVDVPGRRLVYVKTPCAAHWQPRGDGAEFLLHAVPFTPRKLPPDRALAGFVNLDDAWFNWLRRSDAECVFWVRLPDYPLARVRTGQYATRELGQEGGISNRPPTATEPAYENLWSATFQLPLARSVWEVRAGAQGRGLEYVKASCEPSDTAARFFLHVHPAADMPEASAERGYANLDFAWDRAGGAVADGGCRVTAALPDHPIAFVRTGQFRGGVVTRRLWSVRIDFAEPSAGVREGEPLAGREPSAGAARERAVRGGGGTRPPSGDDA